MKIFRDKESRKKTVKIMIYSVTIAVLHILSMNVRNQSAVRFCIAVEIALMVLIIRILMKNRTKILFSKIKEIVKKAFKPITDKIQEIYNRKRKFVKGSDKKKLILNFNIVDKLKNKLKLRQKLDLKHSSSNTEKIRLLYIKFILTLIEKHYKVRYSYTPKEIKTDLSRKEHDIIFDIYEKIRYGYIENITVSDDMVNLCENAVGKFRK